MVSTLSQLDTKKVADAGVTIALTDPYTAEQLTLADGSVMSITVLGRDSAKMREYVRKVTDKRLEELRKNKSQSFSLEESESEKAGALAAVTVAWNLPPIDEGSTVAPPCTESNARALYSDPRFPWIVEQLDAVIADRASFFKAASTA